MATVRRYIFPAIALAFSALPMACGGGDADPTATAPGQVGDAEPSVRSEELPASPTPESTPRAYTIEHLPQATRALIASTTEYPKETLESKDWFRDGLSDIELRLVRSSAFAARENPGLVDDILRNDHYTIHQLSASEADIEVVVLFDTQENGDLAFEVLREELPSIEDLWGPLPLKQLGVSIGEFGITKGGNGNITVDTNHPISVVVGLRYELVHQYISFPPFWIAEGLDLFAETVFGPRFDCSRSYSTQWTDQVAGIPLSQIDARIGSDLYRPEAYAGCELFLDLYEVLGDQRLKSIIGEVATSLDPKSKRQSEIRMGDLILEHTPAESLQLIADMYNQRIFGEELVPSD